MQPVMKDGDVENFMPRVGGKPFRCVCGGNVFHKPDDRCLDLYECNGCGAWYEAESNQKESGHAS